MAHCQASRGGTVETTSCSPDGCLRMTFDELLNSRVKAQVSRFSDGYQPPGVEGSFRRLMRDSGLLKSQGGQHRTLYSLRHTYATMELLAGTDIHTLAKPMGNSAAM